METLALRKAGPEDRDFAYEVKKAAFRPYAEQVWRWDDAEQRRLHEERYPAQGLQVIQRDGKDIGILALVAEPDCLVVNQLFLLPEHQGHGLGGRCMRRVLLEAAALGVPVRLRVLKVNCRARQFYERLGFTCTGETETHHLMEWRTTPTTGR